MRGVPRRTCRQPIMSKNKTDETAVQQCDDLDIDPDAVDIGDGLKTTEARLHSPSSVLTLKRSG